MDHESDDRHDLVEERLDALSDCLLQKEYGPASRILEGFLPDLNSLRHDVRVRIGMALMAMPNIVGFTLAMRRPLLESARHILRHRDGFSEDLCLMAHLVFHSMKEDRAPDGERNELFAIQDSVDYLDGFNIGEETQSETGRSHIVEDKRLFAHLLICCQSLDDEQIRSSLEEVLACGNSFAIAHACCSVSAQFHIKTQYEYLNRALDIVKGPPGFIADILRRKMFVLLSESQKSDGSMDGRRLLAGALEAYGKIQRLPNVPSHRAHIEYYLAILAGDLGERWMARFHACAAMAIAHSLGMGELERSAKRVRDAMGDIGDSPAVE
ncbi:hypothetical protein A2635_03460 [Candidatus Peribacteria bacterium RIFCSPHIGHO2_01_FULL_51_9]|nr:MAG: hypothetical protein A2635_03460 [Candidatus Peribacteria bacterium RIFCSPHIGHO2_01_FULL_51_9]